MNKLFLILLFCLIPLTAFADFTPSTAEYTSDSYTKLLLHCNGTDASTTFTDDGDTTHTVTAVADAQIATAQKKFGTASGLFDGTGDYLTIPDHADWNFGSGDFTIDLWLRFDTSTTDVVLYSHKIDGDNHATWYWDSTNEFRFVVFEGTAIIAVEKGTSLSDDTWYHCALVRDGDDFKFFVDGVQQGTTTTDSSAIPDHTDVIKVGSNDIAGSGSGTYLHGWIDEYRISKGIARDWVTEVGQVIYIRN